MKNSVRMLLQVAPDQAERLQALQKAFSDVCNALAPIVRDTRTWNRVALHHMAYKSLREQFPAMGSQMVCNAIYSVSRTARAVYQDPASPVNAQKLAGQPLPLLRFAENSPVYFDRHTLSLRGDQLSLYTLDGRMRFRVGAAALAQAGFHERKLREVVLARRADGMFELTFLFARDDDEAAAAPPPRVRVRPGKPIPSYVQLEKGA